jgi:hypothetical protein
MYIACLALLYLSGHLPKREVVTLHGHEGIEGVEIYLHSFHIFALNGTKLSISHPGLFTPRQKTPLFLSSRELHRPQGLSGSFE